MHLARQTNPDCEMYFPVTVTFLDIAGAQDLIAQRNKGTRIDMRYTKALENKASNTLVGDIIRDNNADRIYRTKIVKTAEELKAGAGLILFYELSDAIEEEYKLGKVAPKVRINNLREWIVEFMNELAGIMFNEWIPAKTRGKSWAGRHYAFPAYIMLSAMLKDRPDWKKLLPIIMSDIDYTSINIDKTSTERAIKSIKSIIKTKTEEVMNKHVL